MKYNKIIIANWKMNLHPNQAIDLTKEIHLALQQKNIIDDKQIVICPSFLVLNDISKIVKNSPLVLGAQDVFYEEEGAFTGEVSAENLKELDCKYVILGHSERRARGEKDFDVNKKVKAVLEHQMIPIICVGETLEERKSNRTEEIISRQVKNALIDIKSNNYFIMAYEPVWSISTSGSGQIISVEEANKGLALIKQNIPQDLKNFDIIYGGSVKPNTVAEFTKEFKGALVGRASLEIKSFIELIKNS